MRHVLHSDKGLQSELWSNAEFSQHAHCTWALNCPDSSPENSRSLASLMVADEIYSENYEPHFHGYDEDDYLLSMPSRFIKWRSLIFQHFGPFLMRRPYAKSIRLMTARPSR